MAANPPPSKLQQVIELLQGGGQFVLMLIIALGVVFLIYQVGELMTRLDVSKVDPTQLIILIVGQGFTVLGMAAAFYFGKQAQAAS